MKLSTLFKGLSLQTLVQGDAEITNLTIDPSKVVPGTLFIARRSWYFDTHSSLSDVLARGASALLLSDEEALPLGVDVPVFFKAEEDPILGVISARFFEHPTHSLKVFGVTGTNGKTSTCHILEWLLRARGERPAMMGSIAYRFEGIHESASNTTPDAIVIQRFARRALDAGATALILEVSSHGLTLQRVAGVSFDCVGFTNLSRDHLNFHETFPRYAQAKRLLFGRSLAASIAGGKHPSAVACVDDPHGWEMLQAVPRGARRFAVGFQPSGAPPGTSLSGPLMRVFLKGRMSLDGMQMRLSDNMNSWSCHTRLVGEHHLINTLLAARMVEASGGGGRKALERLREMPDIPGRFERACDPAEDERAIFIDHAHTPDAVINTLQTLAKLGARADVVVGCGGERDPSKRGPILRACLDHASDVWITSDNARGESPSEILDAMESALRPPERVRCHRIEERSAAIEAAVNAGQLSLNPLILLGKGHETTQETQGIHYHFDDREEVRRALVAWRLGISAALTPLFSGWSLERVAEVAQGVWCSRGLRRPLGPARRASAASLESESESSVIDEVIFLEDALKSSSALKNLQGEAALVIVTGKSFGLMKGLPGLNLLWVEDLDAALSKISQALLSESQRRLWVANGTSQTQKNTSDCGRAPLGSESSSKPKPLDLHSATPLMIIQTLCPATPPFL